MGGSPKTTPDVYIDYILCEKFGWTPSQLNEQDSSVINDFIGLIEMESKKQKFDNNKSSLYGKQ